MTLRHYLHLLRKRWLTLALFTIAGVAAAAAVTATSPQVYKASSTSFVRMTGADNKTDSLYQNSQFALSQVVSYTQMVHSPAVLEPVIRELHLHMSVAALDQQITATNPTSSVLITVTATSTKPLLAQAIANKVAVHLGQVIEKLETPKLGGKSPVTLTLPLPATEPRAPTSPRPPLNIALGLMVGFALGAGIAVIRHQFDTTVKSIEVLQEMTGLRPLGVVAHDSDLERQPLAALAEVGPAVEDFRSIRTSLQFTDVDHPLEQMVLTSAMPQAGKTLTACNLAITLAQSDLRVCLVEGDLRRPQASNYLGIDGSVGLTNAVAGQHTLDDVLVGWNRGQLTVLPAGTPPPDPTRLLGSDAMSDLLAELRSRFDMVVIDAPPILPVSDALVLGGMSDGAVLVARYGKTRQDQFVAAIEALGTANTRLIGTILTHVPAKERAARKGNPYVSPTGKSGRPRVDAHVGRVGEHTQAIELDGLNRRPAGATTSSPARQQAAAQERDIRVS